MGYCRECSSYVPDSAKFCQVCGSGNLEKNVINSNTEIPVSNSVSVERGPWKVFAKIGFIISLVSIICAMLFAIFFPLSLFGDDLGELLLFMIIGMTGFVMSMVTFEFGIVFSILGMKSKLRIRYAVTGLILGIVSFVLPWMIIIMTVSLA